VRYQQDLQVALRDRYRRLIVAGYATLGQEIPLVAGWDGDHAALRRILDEAEAAVRELAFDA